MSDCSFSFPRWILALAAAALAAHAALSAVAADESDGNGAPQTLASSGAPSVAPSGAASPAPLSAAQLDQLTAPVALYPDPLLGPILAAATYPLEIVEAARWLDEPANAALHGDQLAAALQNERWDMSVKALIAVPDVLRMMNDNLQWTEQLGDAFLAQQDEVMDSIQRLRRAAMSAGTLKSTPQQTVGEEGEDVTIVPASPTIVYVPYYNPVVVYAPWPWPDYPPYFFVSPADVVFADAIGFGIGIGIVGPLWGGYGWNWPTHTLMVPQPGHRRPGWTRWTHDPVHRAGVPYRDAAVAQRFLGPGANFRPSFRGYESEGMHAPSSAPGTQRGPGGSPTTHAWPAPSGAWPAPLGAGSVPSGAGSTPRTPARVSPSPPLFESFGRGPQVRGDAARGSFSRSAPLHVGPSAGPGGARGGGGRCR